MNFLRITALAVAAVLGVSVTPADAAKPKSKKVKAAKGAAFERTVNGSSVRIEVAADGRKLTLIRVIMPVSCTNNGPQTMGEDLKASISKTGAFSVQGEKISVTGKFLKPDTVKVTATAEFSGDRGIPGQDSSFQCTGGPVKMTLTGDDKTTKSKGTGRSRGR